MLPADIKAYPGCPDTSGMNEVDEEKTLNEFFAAWKKRKVNQAYFDKVKRRKELFRMALRGEFPDDPDFPIDRPPKEKGLYDNFPVVIGMSEEESKQVCRNYWVNWRIENGKKLQMKKFERNRG